MPFCLKSVATRRAVKQAARWAAHLYHRWVSLAPEDPVAMDSFLAALIATRYDIEAFLCPGGRSQRIRSALRTLHDAGEIHGICHAVVLMLAAELQITEPDRAVNLTFVEVAGSELTSLGVPPEHAFGTQPNPSLEGRCTGSPPPLEMLGLLLRN